MIYKSKKNWKDLVDGKSHEPALSRRQFLKAGIATGSMSVLMSNFVAAQFASKAMGAELNCPAPILPPGAIAQLFSEGGPTMGARFFSEQQASLMNAGMAANYGITGQANLLKLGPNMVIDKTSAFGFTILQGPPGYPGGAAAWQTNVLSKISGGGHLGPFNADDGAGSDSGLLAGVSPFKSSQMGKDLKVNVSNKLATWAEGLPSSSVASSTPANLAGTFSLTPAANGLINSNALSLSTKAANSITQALSSVFGTNRKGADSLMTSAGCAFYGNSVLADPNYGTTLFNPANIAALTSKVNVGNLSQGEQGQLSAFYQSAKGVAGGVIMQLNGRDYHGGDPQTDIGPKDIEEARAIVMFLAACDAAQSRGAFIYFSNGQAIANGAAPITATINGATQNMNAPIAQGDAGGSYNAGLILFYNPSGTGPSARFTGTVDANGNAKTDSGVASSQEAVAGLYLSALAWVNNGTIPQTAIAKMNSTGVANDTSRIVVI